MAKKSTTNMKITSQNDDDRNKWAIESDGIDEWMPKWIHYWGNYASNRKCCKPNICHVRLCVRTVNEYIFFFRQILCVMTHVRTNHKQNAVDHQHKIFDHFSLVFFFFHSFRSFIFRNVNVNPLTQDCTCRNGKNKCQKQKQKIGNEVNGITQQKIIEKFRGRQPRSFSPLSLSFSLENN